MELLRTTVPEGAKPQPVGRYLTGTLKLSSTLLRRLKVAEGIHVNGTHVWTNHVVGPGDEIVLVLPGRDAPNVDPEPVPLAIVHEDDDVIVLDKPPGVVVHPTKGCYHGTLANGLAFYFREKGLPQRIHPVHRIDKDTSGLVVFARHPLAHLRLAEQLERHKIDRLYVALVWGDVVEERGVVDRPIALVEGHPVARRVHESGQAAVTEYEVAGRYRDRAGEALTLLRLTLRTGRTHQIRVHMASLSHPLMGDDLYAPSLPPLLPRQALHAATLAFEHPRSGEWRRFESPLPADIAGLLSGLTPQQA